MSTEANTSGSVESLCWHAFPCPEGAGAAEAARRYLGDRHEAGSRISEDLEFVTARQIGWLLEWSRPELDSAVVTWFGAGSEHIVYYEPSTGDVIKLTRPNCFGDIYSLSKEGFVQQRNCSPFEYMNRLDLWEQFFGPGLSLTPIGITDAGQIVSRQRFFVGEPPGQEKVDGYLKASGWVPIRAPFLWKYHGARSGQTYWLGDARDENFVLDPESGEIVPIDIRIWEIEPEIVLQRQILSLIMQNPAA